MSFLNSAGLFNVIPDSGIYRLTFDDADTESGTAVDVWNNNDGSITGATTGQTGLAGYDSGESYSFDGSDDVVDVPRGAPDPCSVAIWLQPNDFNNAYAACATRDGNNNGFLIRSETDGSVTCYVGNGSGFDSVSAGSISTSSPTHIVMAIDDTNSVMEAYKDGSSQGTVSISRTFGDNIDIGQSPGTGKNFNGLLDDPRLYDKRLSDTEVSNLYNTGSISG